MGRVFLSLLLTINLLACPLRCGSCTAVEPVVDVPAEPACCCCAQKRAVPESEPPADRPDKQCQCQDCICAGATLQAAPRLPDSTSAAVFISPRVDKAVGNKMSLSMAEPHDCSIILGGRGMRIAHQSLLI